MRNRYNHTIMQQYRRCWGPQNLAGAAGAALFLMLVLRAATLRTSPSTEQLPATDTKGQAAAAGGWPKVKVRALLNSRARQTLCPATAIASRSLQACSGLPRRHFHLPPPLPPCCRSRRQSASARPCGRCLPAPRACFCYATAAITRAAISGPPPIAARTAWDCLARSPFGQRPSSTATP